MAARTPPSQVEMQVRVLLGVSGKEEAMKAKRFKRNFIEVIFTEEEVRSILLQKALEQYLEGWPANARMEQLSGGGMSLEWPITKQADGVEEDS